MRNWSFISYQIPEKDPLGLRALKLWAIAYRRTEDGKPVGMPEAEFLIAATDEKECRWHLERWFAGVFGWSTDANDLYYDQWVDRGWDAVVFAPEQNYDVKAEIAGEGVLDRRGILFTAYRW